MLKGCTRAFVIAALVLGHQAASANPITAPPSSRLPLPAFHAPKLTAPPLLASPGVTATSTAAPMSLWRKLGFGLVLTGPALVGTGVYLGVKTRDQSKAVATFCQRGCGEPDGPRSLMEKLSGAAPWLLVGAGTAALLGGGLLLWNTRASTRVQLGLGVRGGGPVALVKGRF
jgi:hypothetical protein